MNFDECIRFANENPSSYIATVEGNQPRVRGMLMWFADKTGFYYHTGANKPLYKQLVANPKVEVCFFNNKLQGGVMMRVAGEVEFVNDKALKKKLVEARTFLKTWGFTEESPELIIFRIPKGEAYFWTMETNFDPKKALTFG